MTNFVRKIAKGIQKFIIKRNIVKQKYIALYNLEADLGFLEETNDKVFNMTEEEMRKKKEGLEFKVNNKTISDEDKLELEDIESKINKYTEIKGVQVNTRAELDLVKKYIKFLEK